MGMGKPIIASDIPAHRAFLSEDRAILFKNNPEALANSIEDLLNNPAKMSSLSSNSLRYANNEYSGTGDDSGFSMWEVGLNTKWPVRWNIQNRPTDLNVFFVYSGFMNDMQLVNLVDENAKINRLYKVGVALNSVSNFSILGINFRGGGLTFTYGEGFTGIGITTGFPF